MPITVPAFTQFQGVLVPLRGLWNQTPSEGYRFINAELAWGSYQPSAAVQFQLSGNSPVSLTQIVALFVDNRRCGVDVNFVFPDSGFTLTVPAHGQALSPVLTNALMFYVVATGAAAGDVSVVQILNSLPPPIPLLPTALQAVAGVTGINAATGGTSVLIAPPTNGTLQSLSLTADLGGTTGTVGYYLQDGAGNTLWYGASTATSPNAQNETVNITGMAVRFKNGLSLIVTPSGSPTGTIIANVYYSTP